MTTVPLIEPPEATVSPPPLKTVAPSTMPLSRTAPVDWIWAPLATPPA